MRITSFFENRFKLKVFLVLSIFACINVIIVLPGCKNPSYPPPMSYQFLYDANNHLTGWIDADGRMVKFELGKEERLTGIQSSKQKTTFKYDANGNLVNLNDGKGNIDYKYDEFNRLSEASYKYSPLKTVKFLYDPFWRFKEIDIINEIGGIDYWIKYEWDFLGNLTRIQDPNGIIQYWQVPSMNQVIRELPNGIKSTFTYNNAGELISIRHLDKLGAPIAYYQYEHDFAGNVISAIEEYPDGIKTWKYEWDTRNYLKTLQFPDGSITNFEYDPMGNRIKLIEPAKTTTYEYDKYNRLIKSGNDNFKYDRAGHLITSVENGKHLQYKWNDFDQMIEAKAPGSLLRYKYDPTGNIVSRIENKEITHYLPNPIAPPGFTLGEFDKTGKIKSTYLYGEGLLGVNDPLKGKRYFLEDGFSSIRHITDPGGKIVGRQEFTPFAEIISQTGEFAGFRMTGERFEPSIGHLFINNNPYIPVIGRYINPTTSLSVNQPRSDGYNFYAHSCSQSPGPRCHQTHGLSYLNNSLYPYYRTNQLELINMKLKLWQQEQDLRNFVQKNKDSINQYTVPELNIPDIEKPNYFASRKLPPKGPKPGPPKPPTGPKPPKPPPWPEPPIWIPVPHPPWPPDWNPPVWPVPPDKQPPRWPPKLFNSPMSFYTNRHLPPKGPKPGEKKPVKGFPPIKPKPWSEPPIFIPVPNPPWPPGWNPPGWFVPPDKKPPNNFTEDWFTCSLNKDFPPNPIVTIQKDIGGIELKASAKFIGQLGHITGCVYDQNSDRLVLVGDGDANLPPVDLSYFALAEQLIGKGIDKIAFSLDPADPKNPSGEWLQCNWFPDEFLKGTNAGNVMFEADWLLKQYSFGLAFDKDGKAVTRQSRVSGYKDMFTLSFENTTKQPKESWNRFWIEIGDAKIKREGNSIVIDDVEIKVLTEQQRVTKKGFEALKGGRDIIAEQFARFFDEHYDEFADEEPVFAQLKEWGKVFGLVKWLHENNIPINIDQQVLKDNISEKFTYTDRIHTISDERSITKEFRSGLSYGTQTLKINLFGGDEVGTKFIEAPDNGEAYKLTQTIQKQLNTNPVQPVITTIEGSTGIIMPFTKAGNDLWKQGKSANIIQQDGLSYHLDANKKVAYAESDEGTRIDLSHGKEGSVTGFNAKSNDGWNANVASTDTGTSMDVNSPRGDKYSYRWQNEYYPSEMTINDKPYAKFEYDPLQRAAKVTYNEGYEEVVNYNETNQPSEWTVTPQQDKVSGTKGRLNMNYDNNGQLTGFKTDTGEYVETDYDGELLRSVKTSNGETKYSYDYENRVTSIQNTDTAIGFSYSGDDLSVISTQRGDTTAKASFENGMLKDFTDLNGGKWSYEYDQNGSLTDVSDPVNASAQYKFDSNDRLSEVVLPGGDKIVYVYNQDTFKNNKSTNPLEISQLVSINYLPAGNVLPSQKAIVQHREIPWVYVGIIGLIVLGSLGGFFWWRNQQVW